MGPINPSDWGVQVLSSLGGAHVAVARSFAWPGAYCASVLKEDKMSSLYIGYGHPTSTAPFAPMPPPPIQQEPDDLEEQKDVPLSEEQKKFEEELPEEGEEEAEE